MIMKTELIKQVKDYFDLNIYETKVWLALLAKGIASAGEVAEMSGVPRSRTYDVLESLEKRGFAIMKLGKQVKYIAVKPNIVIEKLKSKTINEANEKVSSISKLKETDEYQELEHLYVTGIKPIKREDISASLRGKSIIYNHIKELLENAGKEVTICSSAQEVMSKARFFSLIFEKLKKSKIKMKIALSGDEKEIEKINKKFKIKVQPITIDSRFFIIDNEQVVFIIANSNLPEEEIAIWLNTPFFASALSFLFDAAVK